MRRLRKGREGRIERQVDSFMMRERNRRGTAVRWIGGAVVLAALCFAAGVGVARLTGCG